MIPDHPDHPDDAQKMIDMLMRHEDMTDIHPVIPGMSDLMQDGVAASSIHQQPLLAAFDDETGVLTLTHKSIPCSRHGQSHDISSKRMSVFIIHSLQQS